MSDECTSTNNGAQGDGDDAKKKWACAYCTYLNWMASAKCVLCLQPRNRPMLIEELCPPSDHQNLHATYSGTSTASVFLFPDEQQQLAALATEEPTRWPCPTCTYMNCRRTKRCVQCRTERPAVYLTPPNSGSSPKASSTAGAGGGGQNLSRALNKWTCDVCTFDNWPTASKCTICGKSRQQQNQTAAREQSQSPPHSTKTATATNQNQVQSRRGATPQRQQPQRQLERQVSTGAADDATDQLNQLSLNENVQARVDYTSALDIYLRRFLANDPLEKLFFKAASAVGHREAQMVNKVVDYLINEGNLQRALTAFEARLMNQYIARGGNCRVVGFERADSLFYLAKKSDCLDLMKLIRRVRTDEDLLPCGLNCAVRNRLFAKVSTQCMAIRDGPGGAMGQFKCQFVAQPHNFNLLNMPMPGSDLSLAVQNALFRPAPSIPPQLCYVDCFDAMASQGGLVVGKPPNFLMRNRGGAHSLYDAVFQCMFGACDRFNILRAATKYTMHRSAHLFKVRWLEQQLRMVRDCGLSVGASELDADWEEILRMVGEEDECPEPIHIWALAHVCCRPIIVCPMDDPVDVDELLLPLGGLNAGRSSPRVGGAQSAGQTGGAAGFPEGQSDQLLHEKPPARHWNQQHCYEGIYLPMLWAPSAPISRSPLLLCYRNGLFHAVIVSDGFYQRDPEVQRYVRLRRSLRRPGTTGDSVFRFLNRAELDNSALLAQFLLFGHCTAQHLSVRREAHPHLPETLHFYRTWMQAMLVLSVEQNVACGGTTPVQLESRMDSICLQSGGAGGGKKRKGSALQQHQHSLLAQLFAPALGQQFHRQLSAGLHNAAAATAGPQSGRSSPVDDTLGGGNSSADGTTDQMGQQQKQEDV